MKSQFTNLRIALCLCAVASLASSASAELVEYSGGHGDVGLAYEDFGNGDELFLHYHFGDNAILTPASMEDEFDPSEAYVRAKDETQFEVLAGAESYFDNVFGTTFSEGDTFFRLPASSPGALPFLGIATDELDGGLFNSATLTLENVMGPGAFALWQDGAPNANVSFRSSDGYTDDDLLLGIGTHDHYNWGFTEAGVYDITLTATANLTAGGTVTDTANFKFAVGTLTAVPEPSSFVALASLGIAGVFRRRRKA